MPSRSIKPWREPGFGDVGPTVTLRQRAAVCPTRAACSGGVRGAQPPHLASSARGIWMRPTRVIRAVASGDLNEGDFRDRRALRLKPFFHEAEAPLLAPLWNRTMLPRTTQACSIDPSWIAWHGNPAHPVCGTTSNPQHIVVSFLCKHHMLWCSSRCQIAVPVRYHPHGRRRGFRDGGARGFRCSGNGGGLAEPTGEVVTQVLLIVADPDDVAVGAEQDTRNIQCCSGIREVVHAI